MFLSLANALGEMNCAGSLGFQVPSRRCHCCCTVNNIWNPCVMFFVTVA